MDRRKFLGALPLAAGALLLPSGIAVQKPSRPQKTAEQGKECVHCWKPEAVVMGYGDIGYWRLDHFVPLGKCTRLQCVSCKKRSWIIVGPSSMHRCKTREEVTSVFRALRRHEQEPLSDYR